MRKSGLCQRHADPFRHYKSRLATGVRKHDGELFSSVTCHQASGTAAPLDSRSHYFQALVTSLMPIAIVVEFEMIHVANQQ